MFLAFLVGASEGLMMFLVRNLWGYAYSNEEEVAGYTARMMPILAMSILFDAPQCVLSGTNKPFCWPFFKVISDLDVKRITFLQLYKIHAQKLTCSSNLTTFCNSDSTN